MLALTMSASPPDGATDQSAAAMIARSVARLERYPPVEALTMSAPGAVPAYVPFRLAIAPATQVGGPPPPLPYDSEPVVL